jgi:hypothetical protein
MLSIGMPLAHSGWRTVKCASGYDLKKKYGEDKYNCKSKKPKTYHYTTLQCLPGWFPYSHKGNGICKSYKEKMKDGSYICCASQGPGGNFHSQTKPRCSNISYQKNFNGNSPASACRSKKKTQYEYQNPSI